MRPITRFDSTRVLRTNFKIIILASVISSLHCLKQKPNKTFTRHPPPVLTESPEDVTVEVFTEKQYIPDVIHREKRIKMMEPRLVEQWAKEISKEFFVIEDQVVRRDEILKNFNNFKTEVRDGATIADGMAATLEELLTSRIEAAKAIMRKAEKLSQGDTVPSAGYRFNYAAKDLDKVKPEPEVSDSEYDIPLNCRNLEKLTLYQSKHFNASISLDNTSVHVSSEVFDCDPLVLKDLYWSESLLSVFKENYAQDASLDFQYFCSAKGFLRHYPAASWESIYNLRLDTDDIYDCRLRPWYVSAGGAPRDVLIMLDASGSMANSSNQVTAEQFTLALLSALTDDDMVNVLRFNNLIESPISCFNDKLVPANHINSAAMMAAIKQYTVINDTKMEKVLEYGVKFLQNERTNSGRPPACQQAIVLITDQLYANHTEMLRRLDPEGHIRLFIFWLHDPFGLRDDTHNLGISMSCDRDGYFAEMLSATDVTNQVMQIFKVLERPLVAQRKDRIVVFSDVYAHVEDPRRAEYYWQMKEKKEQLFRYQELRRDKERLLDSATLEHDFQHYESLDRYGHYYEGENVNYRLEISISVPVFEHTTSENITKKLDENKQRNSTRMYPVNRLLGVTGVDVPIDHLKLMLPYYQVGAGGSLFLLDHRGNIVIHDNLRPVFDGDILKPGYRTVDFLETEQYGEHHSARVFKGPFKDFREEMLIEKPKGSRELLAKDIFEDGLRVIVTKREYHWRRILDHYTAVVVLPKTNRRHAIPDGEFTKELAKETLEILSRTSVDFSIHPQWLYCRHIERYFEDQNDEIRHFLRRRSDDLDFENKKIKYVHLGNNLKPMLQNKTYQCDEQLMVRFCKEALATHQWAMEHEDDTVGRECKDCQLGSVTAFFTSESGLTRWQIYHMTTAHAQPPEGNNWPYGPSEPFYRRASYYPETLIIHAPLMPVRRMRNIYLSPPAPEIRDQWITAARTLGLQKKGIIGVAGFHFYPEHLEDLLLSITNTTCQDENEDKCEVRCEGQNWQCLLVDEGGWVVGGDPRNGTSEDPMTRHLATTHPHAMKALLDKGIYKMDWVYDYQAVCFPPKDDKKKSSAATLPSLLKSAFVTMRFVIGVAREFAFFVTFIATTHLAQAETEEEIAKRRRRLRKDFERERFDSLYDPRVVINRTRFAACDRVRAFYTLQRTAKNMELLRRAPNNCSWPLTGAEVPGTNLLLIAVFTKCPRPPTERMPPDPFHNVPWNVSRELKDEEQKQTAASQLACFRNKIPLNGRPPHTTCYPHNYNQEVGYRQCGPWLPDPEVEYVVDTAGDIGSQTKASLLLTLTLIILKVLL